jgi:predicted HicB family RNase H-like nuclease
MSTMTIDGFHAKIEYDADLDQFRGEILGLTGGADFYGKNPRNFAQSSKSRWPCSCRCAGRRE